MLIDRIKSSFSHKYFCDICEENGFGVDVSTSISKENILIIKVDKFYSDRTDLVKLPPSPDCLIIQHCSDGTYHIYIIELKNICDSNGFSITNIREKFETCLNDFMKGVLGEFFIDTDYIIRRIDLFFVTDPYNESLRTSNHRLNKTTKIDALLAMNTKALRFDGKLLGIQHAPKNPLVNNC